MHKTQADIESCTYMTNSKQYGKGLEMILAITHHSQMVREHLQIQSNHINCQLKQKHLSEEYDETQTTQHNIYKVQDTI